MKIPITLSERLEYIARETARMSYPGSMSRGIKPLVNRGTKHALEEYFATKFPLDEIFNSSDISPIKFDLWHRNRVQEIARSIRGLVNPANDPKAISAKFLNTFMHQLMKYKEFHKLFSALHLPLDARVFTSLRQIHFQSLHEIQYLLSRSPYVLTYPEYMRIQIAMLGLIDDLNSRPEAEFKLCSRIELNWLWVK